MEQKAVVIIGSGIMGRDIAAIFLAGGWQTQLVARNTAQWADTRRLLETSARQIGNYDDTHVVFRADIDDIDWQHVQVVLEVVPEQLALKQALFAKLDAAAPPHVVFGSNSSGIRISDIARGLAGAGRMANTHFFQPAHLVPLVEIAQGEATTSDTMDTLYDIFASLGRAPVRVNRDLPGFLANRIQHALMREAFAVIDSGLASAEDVDVAVQFGFGFRYAAAGPMLLKEIAGFDTQHAAATAIYPSLCNDTAPGKTLSGLVAHGRLGMKSKAGFRDWTDDAMAEERTRYEAALVKAVAVLGSPKKDRR